MANKAETKELKLEDFFTNTINANGSKMFLMLNGEQTEHYLVVKGIDCKSSTRDRINTRNALTLIEEQLKGMEESDLKTIEQNRLTDEAYKPLAIALVSGWSFGDFDTDKVKRIFDENEGLAFAVAAHASDQSNLKAKK